MAPNQEELKASTDSTFLDLFHERLEEARRGRNGNIDGAGSVGLTIDLSHQKISIIPVDVIELMRLEIERLAISHNQLTGFPNEFATCSRLRYLNVRSNLLKEFPQVICALESLEILDISRNRIKILPADFGYLTKLKVLSISKNKIQILPCAIGHMDDLKILKLDHNPIIFPPRDILGYGDSTDGDKDLWLEELKHYLRQHDGKTKSGHESDDSGGSSTDGGADTDYSSIQPHGIFDVTQGDLSDGPHIDEKYTQSRMSQKFGSNQDKNAQRGIGGPGIGWNGLNPMNPIHPLVASAISQTMERTRSNSESTVVDRAARRMGYIGHKQGTKRDKEAKTIKHHVRGISYDSSLNEANQRNNNTSAELSFANERQVEIRRLSCVMRSKTNPASNLQATALARSLLYAMTQMQPILLAFVSIMTDKNKTYTGLDRIMPAVSMNVGILMHALEAHGATDGSPILESLTSACNSCAVTFRHVVGELCTSFRDMRDDGDIKYAKTLLLMTYGSLMEISNSWSQFRFILPPFVAASIGSSAVHNSSTKLGLSSTTSSLSAPSSAPNLQQGRGFDAFMIPPTPVLSAMDNHLDNPDEALFEKLASTLSSTIQVITLFLEAIKSSTSSQVDGRQPITQNGTLAKLRELHGVCMTGIDISKRLKTRLETIRDADPLERRRFTEDITRFVNSIMLIGERAKAGSSEFQFQKHVLTSFSPIARSTKEVTLLLHMSSFRGLNDVNLLSTMHTQLTSPAAFNSPMMYQPTSPQSAIGLPSTPLSAALGAATQATLPLSANMHNTSISSMLSSGRSETMSSQSRTNTGVSESTFLGLSSGSVDNPGYFSPRRM